MFDLQVLLRFCVSRFVEYMGPNGFVIKQVPIPMYQFLDWDSYIKIATLGLCRLCISSSE